MQFILTFAISLQSLAYASISHGPIIGDLTSNSVRLWVRTDTAELVETHISGIEQANSINTSAATDYTHTFAIKNLEPATRYEYSINGEHQDDWFFTTRPVDDSTSRIAFGSCANEKEGSSKVWNQINNDAVDALVLLGDTPYIDTTDLEIQRKRYREFAAVPAFAKLVSHTPLYSTWDDHDFGRNDTDGNLEGKEFSRQACVEYRPNPSAGEYGLGIYTSFAQGPVEVFLLDARWFARTEISQNNIPTLLGKQQWDWLERSLKASTASYKILACGMIFNGATRPGKPDHWGNYPTEYARLLSIIKRHSISGIVLVSGDIHWSRVIQHDTNSKIGYNLIEFITSPVHEKLILAANASHDGDIFSVGEVNSYLLLDASSEEEKKTLSMKLRNASGKTLYEYVFDTPPSIQLH